MAPSLLHSNSALCFSIPPAAACHLSRGSTTDPMASNTFASEDAIKAIAENGFYHVQDPMIGRRISDMEENRFQFSTTSTAALQFYRENVHDNEVNQLENEP
ncbi:hypothetical protein F66182_7551 [Fusarium sp. NRRL 66182]|nr:hypothetical protein F66182_7551 [Fusarium sp. NRRL 66182]